MSQGVGILIQHPDSQCPVNIPFMFALVPLASTVIAQVDIISFLEKVNILSVRFCQVDGNLIQVALNNVKEWLGDWTTVKKKTGIMVSRYLSL